MSWQAQFDRLTDLHNGATHDTKLRMGPIEDKEILLATLSRICHGLSITPNAVYNALSQDDIDDWHNGDISHETLIAFAHALVQQQDMTRGKRPKHYIKQANCQQCGPVWLWCEGNVIGCPWCWHHFKGYPIPRP